MQVALVAANGIPRFATFEDEVPDAAVAAVMAQQQQQASTAAGGAGAAAMAPATGPACQLPVLEE